jgi:hypothetical protein
MNLRTHIRRQPWMTQAEWQGIMRLRRAYEVRIKRDHLAHTPELAIRLNAFLNAWLLHQRTQLILTCPPDGAPQAPDLAMVQAICMANENHLRALDDLEAHLAKAPKEQPKPASKPVATQSKPTPTAPQPRPGAIPQRGPYPNNIPPRLVSEHKGLISPVYISPHDRKAAADAAAAAAAKK